MLRAALLGTLLIIGMMPMMSTASANCTGVGGTGEADQMITVCHCYSLQYACGEKQCTFTAGTGSDPDQVHAECRST